MALKSTSMRFALLISAFFIIICLPALAATHGEFDRTLKVSGSVNLQVEPGSGSIDVRTGNSSEVHVVGHIRATEWFGDNADEKIKRLETNPPIQQSGNDIRIGHIDDPELRHNISISYEVIVPAETELRVESGSGNQTVEGIRGPLEVTAGSGGLNISGIGERVR